jgi:5-methylcytosine-specific restriction enzyme A
MLRRCLGGCGALINSGSYCSRCRPRNGSTRQWRKLRDQILARDRWTCRRCGERASHIDHITPIAAGGTDHPANLQALCGVCNLAKGAR